MKIVHKAKRKLEVSMIGSLTKRTVSMMKTKGFLALLSLCMLLVPSIPVYAENDINDTPEKAVEISKGTVLAGNIPVAGVLWYKITPRADDLKFSHYTFTLSELSGGEIRFYDDWQSAKEDNSIYYDESDAWSPAELEVPIAWKGPSYISISGPAGESFSFSVDTSVVEPIDYPNGGVCFAEASVDRKPNAREILSALRSIRDGLLVQTAKGQKITSLYYQASPYLVKAMLLDEGLRESAYEDVAKLRNVIRNLEKMAEGRSSTYRVTEEELDALLHLKEMVKAHVPDYLGEQIEALWDQAHLSHAAGKKVNDLLKEAGLVNKGLAEIQPNEILVKVAARDQQAFPKSLHHVHELLAASGVTASPEIEPAQSEDGETALDHTYVIKLRDSKKMDEVLEELQQNEEVEYAVPNRIYRIASEDIYYPYQWSLENTGQDDGKAGADISYPGLINSLAKSNLKKVMIAVVDTGVNYKLADLDDVVRSDLGKDFVNDDEDAFDDNDHGTHVSGIIAAAANNGFSISGIHPSASILPVKALDEDGSGSSKDIALGIRYAVDKGANVINLSLGTTDKDPVLEDALKYAAAHNVFVVAAAGNDSSRSILYPASSSYAFAVGATNNQDELASFSNYGAGLDIVAPGERIPSLVVNGNTYYASGTSMATPHVAAVAGLMYAIKPDIKREEIGKLFEKNSDDLGSPGYDEKYGWGRLNAEKMVKALLQSGDGLTADVEQVELGVKEQRQIHLTLKEKGKSTDVTNKAQWSIKNKSIGTVTRGLVTAKKEGKTEITATYKGKTVRIPLIVTEAARVGGSRTETKASLLELMRLAHFSYSSFEKYKAGSDRYPKGATIGDIISQKNWQKGELAGLVKDLQDVFGKDYMRVMEDMKKWRVIDDRAEPEVGFYGVVFEKDGEIVIAFRGTDDLQDLAGMDLDMFKGVVGPQIFPAAELTAQTFKKNPNKKIVLTGHSLGGWLAERIALDIVGKKDSLDEIKTSQLEGAVTFNAPGFNKDFEDEDYMTEDEWEDMQDGKFDRLVTNYVITDDPVSTGSIFSDHVGKTVVLPYLDKKFIDYPYQSAKRQKSVGTKSITLKEHSITNFYYYDYAAGEMVPSVKDDHLVGTGGSGGLKLSLAAEDDGRDDMDGRDWFDGGPGDDKLSGGFNNDTYLFGYGYGHDEISDLGGHDTIECNADRENLVLEREGDDLLLVLNEKDILTVKDYFVNDNTMFKWKVEDIKFKNGDVVSTEDLIKDL
ncbi:S8 family serine peptidase [Brevibacillus sp. SYP-B805]|uniref:S8 family serine peptidase n=1 Tax=Brevibacillus sp. SYP-B805 TaxID=1578199 RepID=UPI0013EE155A|nr:S8 family serine peptidase [Brevibacillus sp. SYP-B805]NGQ95602.1 S8 family serine peptidase [Brevibacillus sp. SYP-B805]